MRPLAPSFTLASPAIRVKCDPLITLPSRMFSCVTAVPRRRVTVHALTEAGARLEAAHKLGVMPSRVLVVEIERRLAGSGAG